MNQSNTLPVGDVDLSDYLQWQLTTSLDLDNMSDFQLCMKVSLDNGNTWQPSGNTYNRVTSVFYDAESDRGSVVCHLADGTTIGYNFTSPTNFRFSTDNYTQTPYITYVLADGTSNTYADVTKGYTMPIDGEAQYNWWVPNSAVSSVMFTLDLSDLSDSLTITALTNLAAPDYRKVDVTIQKVTVDGVTSLAISGTDTKMVYDTVNTDNNAYQVVVSKTGVQFNYIGPWPQTMGGVNAVRSYTYDWAQPLNNSELIRAVQLSVNTGSYPIMRVESSMATSTTFNAIVDYTYSPAQILQSDSTSTKINAIDRYGSSISFGGYTYTVSNRSIVLGTHSTTLTGITFESVSNGATFDNRINGETVSTTATPSTIVFNGIWVADVQSAPMTTETHTVNKWVPGGFAFSDGVGFDFYLVGLLTSVVSFIALAMYGRKSGAKVGSLMLICGGAAFMFLLLM